MLLLGPRCSRGTRSPQQQSLLQKIIATRACVHEYIAYPQIILTDDLRACPFCSDHHRLQSNGSYERFVIVEGGAQHRIPVLRLRCVRTGHTLSLLPDFCLPGRQHGPAVLGVFLEALILGGLTLTGAMRRARPDTPSGHSLPQSLLHGFLRRLAPIRTWLASRRHRFPDLAAPPRLRPIEWVQTVAALLEAGASAGAAFTASGRRFHAATGLGLA